MNAIPDKSDYVRYALYSAGITPTDEEVEQIYATGYPYQTVDALVAAFHACREVIVEQTRKLYADVYRVTPKQRGELKEQFHQPNQPPAQQDGQQQQGGQAQ